MAQQTSGTTFWDFVQQAYNAVSNSWGPDYAAIMMILVLILTIVIVINGILTKVFGRQNKSSDLLSGNTLIDQYNAYSEALHSRLDEITQRNTKLREELDSTYEDKWRADRKLAQMQIDYKALQKSLEVTKQLRDEAISSLAESEQLREQLRKDIDLLNETIAAHRRALIAHNIDPETGQSIN